MKKVIKKQKSSKIFFTAKRKRVYFTAAILAAAIILFLSMGFRNKDSDWNVIATVNDEPVYVREFKAGMQKNRAAVYAYFKKKYGIDGSKSFWSDYYGGESPMDVIHKNTLDELIRIKVQQILFMEKGLQKDIGYKNFINDLKKENKRRQEAVKNNEISFGPTKYGESEYFNYTFNNMVTKLKEKLSQEEFTISDEGLKQIYEKDKDKLYRKPDYFKLQKISLKTGAGNLSDKDLMIEIKERLDKGEDPAEVVKSCNKETGNNGLNVTELISDETTAIQDDRTNVNLRTEAEKLSQGQISGVFEENNTLNIIKCIERQGRGYYGFDEIKGIVKSKYIDDKYKEYIDKLANEAEVKIVEKVYNSVKADN